LEAEGREDRAGEDERSADENAGEAEDADGLKLECRGLGLPTEGRFALPFAGSGESGQLEEVKSREVREASADHRLLGENDHMFGEREGPISEFLLVEKNA
jgi:hypothetical protein